MLARPTIETAIWYAEEQVKVWWIVIILLQGNSFQVVLVTDGVRSYAVFTYKCGELHWANYNASIGFSASSSFFANHPLSRQSNVNSIACLNSPTSQWSNVLYQISGKTRLSKPFVCLLVSSAVISLRWHIPPTPALTVKLSLYQE